MHKKDVLDGAVSGSVRHDVPGSGHIAKRGCWFVNLLEMLDLNIKMKKRRTVVQALTVNVID
jgi:hypothetical protein